MTIKDIMTPNPRVCSPATNLGAAAELMLDGDCGILPVVVNGRLVGVVTDRDMFIAMATRDKRASELSVGDVATTDVLSCQPDQDVQAVLTAMKARRVRRIPVEGFDGNVVGIVSMSDLLLEAGPRKAIRNEDVVATCQVICTPHDATPHVTAA